MSINHRELCVQVRCTHTYIHTSTRCSPQRFRLMRWSSNQRRVTAAALRAQPHTAHSAQPSASPLLCVVDVHGDGATARRRSLWNFVALCRSLTFFVCALRSRLWTVDCGLCGLWSVDCLGVGLRGAVTYLLYPYLHEHNARTAPSQPHNTVASAKEVTRPLPRTHFHSLPLPHTVLVLLVLE